MEPTQEQDSADADYEFATPDQEWFDHLGGHLTMTTNAAAAMEGDALRAAILSIERREREEWQADGPALREDDRRLQQLLFALRRERLVDSKLSTVRRWAVPVGLAAALLLGIGVLRPFSGEDATTYYDEPPNSRGELPVEIKLDPQPKRRADALAQQLRDTGIAVTQYQHGSDFLVDIQVPAEQFDAARDALKTAGIEPRIGITRIRISKP